MILCRCNFNIQHMFARIYHLFWTCLCWHKMQESENCFLSCTYLLNKLFSLKTHFGIIFRSSPIKKKKKKKENQNISGKCQRLIAKKSSYLWSLHLEHSLLYHVYVHIIASMSTILNCPWGSKVVSYTDEWL